MKYFFRIVLTLILASATVFGAYWYTNGMKLPSDEQKAVLTTVSKAPATEKYANKRRLASMLQGKYVLYATDDKMLLEHNGNEFEFNKFSGYIEREKPKMYFFDVSGDEQKEIVIRGVSGQEQSTGDYVYDLYILQRESGPPERYKLINATQDTWHNLLDDAITEEITQLKTNAKFVQFAMAISGNTHIEYDKNTGLVTKNAGHVGYARAMQDDKGNYLKVQSWSKGKGSYSVSKDGKLCCNVEVIINYNDGAVSQKTGMIYFEIKLNKEGNLIVTPGSLVFRADKDFRVSDPTDVAKNDWSLTYKNSANPEGSEALNWIKHSFTIDPATLTQTLELGSEDNDIAYIDSTVISNKAVVMTAKNGYTFDSKAAKNGEYSVIMNKGKDDEAEISYKAEISEDARTLTFTLDKSYPQKSLKTVDISYGSK